LADPEKSNLLERRFWNDASLPTLHTAPTLATKSLSVAEINHNSVADDVDCAGLVVAIVIANK
jgi:hypothetical protein